MADARADATDAAAIRAAVLGPDHVARALAPTDEAHATLQRFVTEVAWGTWARGVLERRDRSLLTLAITCALGRMEEFELHLKGAINNGITEPELDEVVLHIGAYAGVPAALAARRSLDRVLTATPT